MRLSVLAPVVVLVLALSPTLIAEAESADDPCSVKFGGGGICTAGGIDSGGVTLQADTTRAGTASSGRARAHSPADPSPTAASTAPQPEPRVPRGRAAADVDVRCQPGVGACFDGEHAFLPPARWPVKPADPVPVAAVTPGVSLADVAQFVPRSASIRSQPNGWAIVGAPVNLFTDATAQVVDGTLLGRPAQVRFVPVSFTWDHGDGTVSTTVGPGASWKQLGQQDFTSTDTSHAYSSIGDRKVALTIAYSPSYRFDGGAWQQIPGTLPVVIGPVTIHVVQGSTVLVGGVCGTRNAGPGC
jgi:hypothetical protein